MKTLLPAYLFSFVFTCFGFYAQAQITITRSDFANVGDFSADATDTVHTGITPGNAGAAQTWNFSTLQTLVIDTNYFMSPAVTAYSANFPSANIVAYNTVDSSYAFMDANSGLINIVGYVRPNPFTGGPLILSFSPPVTQITFPSNPASNFSVNNATAVSTFYYSATYLGLTFDSVRTTTIDNRLSVIDGWGNVITPVGTFSCLRQNLTEITDINVEAHITAPPLGWTPFPTLAQIDTTIHYYYIANSQNWPVAEIQTNYSGTVTSAQYLMNAIGAVPELHASGNQDLIIYPNPSAGGFNVSLLNSKAVLLKVFDVQGNNVGNVELDNSLKSFSMQSFPAGIYMFRVLDKTGAVISTGKLAVQK